MTAITGLEFYNELLKFIGDGYGLRRSSHPGSGDFAIWFGKLDPSSPNMSNGHRPISHILSSGTATALTPSEERQSISFVTTPLYPEEDRNPYSVTFTLDPEGRMNVDYTATLVSDPGQHNPPLGNEFKFFSDYHTEPAAFFYAAEFFTPESPPVGSVVFCVMAVQDAYTEPHFSGVS